MSEIQTTHTNEQQEEQLPGELSCLFAKGIAWITFAIGAIFGVKFLGPVLQSFSNASSNVSSEEFAYAYVFVLCVTSAVLLFVLIAICENLIIMNQKNGSN